MSRISLLGVHDAYRVGGLRFRLNDTGDFLDNRQDSAAPPLVQLRHLEAASRELERDEKNTSKDGGEWLRMLIALGGSLGGARPKASVVDAKGHLWIAKFPSLRDEYDDGGWEQVVLALAQACSLNVPESNARKFTHGHHTFLVQRFDRTSDNRRIHFASAMTLTGRKDGDDAAAGASYLEIARVLIEHGASPAADLRELWSRIVFFMLVSNHGRSFAQSRVPARNQTRLEACACIRHESCAGIRWVATQRKRGGQRAGPRSRSVCRAIFSCFIESCRGDRRAFPGRGCTVAHDREEASNPGEGAGTDGRLLQARRLTTNGMNHQAISSISHVRRREVPFPADPQLIFPGREGFNHTGAPGLRANDVFSLPKVTEAARAPFPAAS